MNDTDPKDNSSEQDDSEQDNADDFSGGVETVVSDGEKEPSRWLRALFIFLAVAMLAGGLYWRHLQIESRKQGKDKPDSGHVNPAKLDPPPADVYAWTEHYETTNSIAARISPPNGFRRIAVVPDSFAHWLRYLPLLPGEQPVRLHTGKAKRNQNAHFAVLDIDTGKRDLQQCADAVIRLRAEYLYAMNRWDEIHFNFTSGDRCDWVKWAKGVRPRVAGNKVTWAKTAKPDNSYKSFRKYLDIVFAYAGTYSLAKELPSVEKYLDMQIGDVFIHPGLRGSGHSVIVVDIAVHSSTGYKVYLLAQSYMPAQDMHILLNPNNAKLNPWYPLNTEPQVRTPEWTFPVTELKRFR
ncbi:MAG: DUF4846 domain-containing protein [Phycisphaerae bacterium]|nr:DUF4846 domain-containing protein [Phycisphaerae bacterium]